MLDISAALKSPGSLFPFEEKLRFEPCEVMGEELTFDEGLIEGEYFGVDETVSIKAALSVTVHAHCAKCLEPLSRAFNVRCEAEFARDGDGEEVFKIVGHEIDVKDAAFEALLLELPMRFLCSEDCKGVCPVCGKNRNHGQCTCPEGVAQPNPFSALINLISDQNNEEV